MRKQNHWPYEADPVTNGCNVERLRSVTILHAGNKGLSTDFATKWYPIITREKVENFITL